MRTQQFQLFVLLSLIVGPASAQLVISPAFSEFQVVFPSKPQEEIMGFTGNDGVDAAAISYALVTPHGALRAEFISISDPSQIDATSDEQMREQMLEYMRHNGLQSSHVVVERRGAVRVVSGRSTKILSDGGADRAATYINRAYYGRRSALMIYASGPSDEYPSDTITAFLDSVSF